MIDVVDMAAYDGVPRPEWGKTDEEFLSHMFSNHKADWVAAGEWFVQVPEDVQPCAFLIAPGKYQAPGGERLTEEAFDQAIEAEAVALAEATELAQQRKP